ncbi:MAG: MBL fold metallo-hydrolase [Steroidobacteraceae bacterium]|nr:MBL fold metallo-hydrolase [Steroidobacteraceae bacterium]
MQPKVTPFFHAPTGTWTYVVSDPATRDAAVIDPVLDYDWRSGRTGTASADAVLAQLVAEGLELRWILETHAHADHLSCAPYLQDRAGGQIAIGQGIRQVQQTFKRIFGLGNEFVPDGRQFDRLLVDGDTIALGETAGKVIATPGHTSDSVSYLFDDALFVGDTVFMPDGGSARCDFPGGDAGELFRSVQRLYELPAATRVFVCHDYSPGGRPPLCETTIDAQRTSNIHLRADTAEADYVALRRARDATLDVPNLIIPSVQVNIRAGHWPAAESDGVTYLKVPLNVLGRPL